MTRILTLGRSGQLARSLVERAAGRTSVEVIVAGRPELDLTDHQALDAAIADIRPDVVINAAAWTAVDKAESEPDGARALNSIAVGALGDSAARRDVPVIHVSTDYVFAGDKTEPYTESDETGPLGVYGLTKLEGERALIAANPRSVIVRTAWIHSPFGQNFVKTMLRLAASRERLGVVGDQYGSPTFATDLADGLLDIASRLPTEPESSLWGVYHLTSGGSCSWAEFAEAVFQRSSLGGGPSAHVDRITTADYPTPARRPQNSRLDCSKSKQNFGVSLPSWRSGVDRCVDRLLEIGSLTA